MYLATTDAANDLLVRDPLALLIGMLLDQQIPMEKAFTSPHVLAQRLGGSLDVRTIAAYDAAELENVFREPPALHRFPAAMAKRVQELTRVLLEHFDGDAASVWTDAGSGTELVTRIAKLPGFGSQKAQIFAALLAKQFDVQPPGWREATGAYGAPGSTRSVADVVDSESLRAVRAFKKQMKSAAKAPS